MNRETIDRGAKHKLLDLVLDAKHDGVHIEFAPQCTKGQVTNIYIHEWEDDEIIASRHYVECRDAWRDTEHKSYTTQEIMEILEGLQDAEH